MIIIDDVVIDILKSEYERYRKGQIENKERFKQAIIKIKNVLRSSTIKIESTKTHDIFIGEKLAKIIPEIALELDKTAIETQDTFPTKVIEGLHSLSKAFIEYNQKISVFSLPNISGNKSSTGIEGDEKFDMRYNTNYNS